MLMRANHRRIEQHGLQVGRLERLEHTLPNARLRPAIESLKDRVPTAKTLGQVAPCRTGSSHPDHGIDEQAIVLGVATRIAWLSRQYIPDAIPFLVRECVAIHRGASLPHENRERWIASLYWNQRNPRNTTVNTN
jgi:hypothetical protein